MARPVLTSDADASAVLAAWDAGDMATAMSMFAPSLLASGEFAKQGAMMAQYKGSYDQKHDLIKGWYTEKDCVIRLKITATCIKDGCPAPYLSLAEARVLKQGEVVSVEFCAIHTFDEETGKVKESTHFSQHSF